MSTTYTIATLNGVLIASVPDGDDIYSAVADAAARADIDIDFRDIDVTEGVTIADEEPAFLDERDGLAAENARLREALLAIVDEVSEGFVPYSSDSYLPAHLVEQARAALGLGGLSNDRARAR